MTRPSFSLLHEPWISVYDDAGQHREVGLFEALTRADQVWVGGVAPGDAAVFRLLAAAYTAAAGPRTTAEWDAAFTAPVPVEQISVYLQQYEQRFDLFHPETPFLQCAGLTVPNGPVGTLNLAQRAAGGAAFFDSRLNRGTGEHPPMHPKEAARALLELMAFDTAGVRAAAPGDPAARGNLLYGGRVGSIAALTHMSITASGLPLLQQILLNCPPGARTDGDTPVWERPPGSPFMEIRSVAGPMDYWTLPTRRVRLFPDEDGLVSQVAIYDGDRSEKVGGALAPVDPMTAWTTSSKTSKLVPLNVLDAQNAARPWAPALLLDARPETCPGLAHTIAAAERGLIPSDSRLHATLVQTVHKDRYRSVMGFIEVQQVQLGSAGQLADPQQRALLAARAHTADLMLRKLVSYASGIMDRSPVQIAPQISLSRLTDDWEAMVTDTETDPDGAGEEWARALTAEALSQANRLPHKHVLTQATLADVIKRGGLVDLTDPDPQDTEALNESPPAPARRTGRKAVKYAAFGGEFTLSQIASLPECVVSYPTLSNRVKGGWPVEEAATTPGRGGGRPAKAGSAE
ncbi:type I-E CRISPR-associated protein Cse1/CasA [Streptomyces sp. NPDC051211]|uniref:type I-E CRISPR-associated protein Cse1/CasA n=1 Tax=Streptomyces sp. NPDC051211 TaxID=3154643 RepID=UPI00344F2B7A